MSVFQDFFTRLRSTAKEHRTALFCAFFLGMLIVGPQLVFIEQEGSDYRGLYMMTTDGEKFYLARMHEFYDEGRVGNPFLYEHKFYGPMFYSSGGETLLAIPGKLLGISVPTLNLIYKFLLPAVQFLLAYALLFRLTGKVGWSIAGALMMFTGLVWFEWEYLKHNLYHALQTGAIRDLWYRPYALYIGRPVHPEFSQLLLLLYLHVSLAIHESKERNNFKKFIALGSILALSFYVYFFSFTFFLAFNAALCVIWYFFGKRMLIRDLLMTTGVAFLVGTPPLWAIYSAMHHPEYARVAQALWVEPTHRAVISLSGLILTLLVFACIVRKKTYAETGIARDRLLFLSGLLVTAFLVVNQQVVTGISLQYIHYFRAFNHPVFVIVLTFLGHTFFEHMLSGRSSQRPRFAFIARALPWCAAGFFAVTGVYFQYTAYLHDAPIVHKEQRYMPAMDWLAANTPKDSVVMTNETLSEFVPLFTNDNVMWNNGYVPAGFLVPSERTEFTPENLLKSEDFFRDAKKYRLDYILWDRQADPGWNIERYKLPLLFSGEGMEIYELPR